MSKQLMKGNEALAEAALRAGCRFYSGYPITPQTELAAYMAKRMPKSAVHICRRSRKSRPSTWCSALRRPASAR